MREETARETPEEIRGHLYIRLKTGRLVTFWDMIDAAEAAETPLVRAISRASKLARDDWDLDRIEARLESLEEYIHAVRAHLRELRGDTATRKKISHLRNTTGRTREEAEAFRRKASELERRLAGSC